MKRITAVLYVLGCYATFILIFGEFSRFETSADINRRDKFDGSISADKKIYYYKRHLSESLNNEQDGATNDGECLPQQSLWCQRLSDRYDVNSAGFELENMTRKKCNLTEYLRNCERFKKAFGYVSFPIHDDELNFPLAFSITVHENVEQIEQLLRNIYRPHNAYCIHVDAKARDAIFEVVIKIARCFDNIIVIQDREVMVHSSFSHVNAELKCMAAVRKTSVNWKYYINLAGDEFPLRTNLELIRILGILNGANDIESYNHPVYLNWKLENKFLVYGNSLAEDGKKTKLKYDLRISRGNPKGAFSRKFVDFIFEDDIASSILTYFKDTFDPAENVWATLVTLPWAPGNYPVEVRHIIHTFASRAFIDTEDSQKCQGRLLRNMCYFGKGDLPWLFSRPEFFAGRFDLNHDPEVLNCLEQHYRHRAKKSEVFGVDWKFIVNLPHFKYHWKNSVPEKTVSESVKMKWIKEKSL